MAEPLFAASKNAGGSIPLTNTVAKAQEIINRSAGAVGPNQAAATERYLTQKLAEFAKASVDQGGNATDIPAMDPVAFQKSMELAGKGAKFGDSAAENLDRSATQKIWGQILHAMRQDLDAAADAGVPSAKPLQVARDAYKKAMVDREAITTSLLETSLGASTKMGGETLENIPAKIWTNAINPTQIAKAANIVKARDPAAWMEFRGAALDAAAENMQMTAKGDELVNGVLSPAKVATFIQKNQAKLNVLFSDDPKSAQMVNDLGAFARKLADKPGAAGSQTQPKGFVERLLGEWGSKLPGVQIGLEYAEKLHGVLDPTLKPSALVRIMNDPKKLATLHEILAARPNMTAQKLMQNASQLTTFIAHERFPLRPEIPTSRHQRPPLSGRIAQLLCGDYHDPASGLFGRRMHGSAEQPRCGRCNRHVPGDLSFRCPVLQVPVDGCGGECAADG
jgi:hypothetical protein